MQIYSSTGSLYKINMFGALLQTTFQKLKEKYVGKIVTVCDNSDHR